MPLDRHLLSPALVVMAVAACKLLPAVRLAPVRVRPPGLLPLALVVPAVALPKLFPGVWPAPVRVRLPVQRAVIRLVAAAIKLYKQSTTMKAQSTGLAPDEVETKVDAQLSKQVGYMPATLEETKTMMDYVHEALPLVVGVVRSVESFEGSPPDDVSPPVVDLVGGGSGAEGSDEADGSSDGENPQPADRHAPPRARTWSQRVVPPGG